MKINAFAISLLALLVLSGCSSVKTVPLKSSSDVKIYQLSDSFNEPPTSFSSHSLRVKAESVCPQGYDILSENVSRASELPYNPATCASTGQCEYLLEWRIQCVKKIQKEFSLFGKF